MAKALQDSLKNYGEHMQGRSYPACFSKEEFRAWKLHEEEINTKPIRGFACRDCTVQYQASMTIEGRCCNSEVDLDSITD